MQKGGEGHVPRCVRDHDKAKERPESIIPERWHQHREHAQGPKDVGPFSFIQVIVDQEDVAADQPCRGKNSLARANIYSNFVCSCLEFQMQHNLF